jgi:hypothetical protein
MINRYGSAGGMKLGSGTEILGENLPEYHFFLHKSHMTLSVMKPEPPQCDLTILSYGTVKVCLKFISHLLLGLPS